MPESLTSFCRLRFLILFLPFMLSACENDNLGQIEWMIPMAPSQDQHTSSKLNNAPPSWAQTKQLSAEILLLNKRQAHSQLVMLSSDQFTEYGNMRIELLAASQHLVVDGSSYSENSQIDNPAIYIKIYKHGHEIFHGWLYQYFPELFGLEDPDWQFWLKAIHFKQSSDQ